GSVASSTLSAPRGPPQRFARLARSYTRSARAALVHDLRALGVERTHPVRDRAVALGMLVVPLHPGHCEHVGDLLVRELPQQVGQELPAGLADGRIAERPLHRLLEVADAARLVLPDRLRLPRREVDLAVVEERGLPEPVPEVLHVHERTRAGLVAGGIL